jgi:DNA-binding transcriptional ArsR family regulator
LAYASVSDAVIEEASRLFLALGDQSRLRIIRALMKTKIPLSQGALAEATGISQANASKHLAILVRAGLAAREPDGSSVYYSPVLPLVEKVCHLVCAHVAERVEATYHAIR